MPQTARTDSGGSTARIAAAERMAAGSSGWVGAEEGRLGARAADDDAAACLGRGRGEGFQDEAALAQPGLDKRAGGAAGEADRGVRGAEAREHLGDVDALAADLVGAALGALGAVGLPFLEEESLLPEKVGGEGEEMGHDARKIRWIRRVGEAICEGMRSAANAIPEPGRAATGALAGARHGAARARAAGKYLVRTRDGAAEARLITEVEAYDGERDLACHARAGRTARTATMYRVGGCWYVYLCYGVHEMLNLVTGRSTGRRRC
jgi:hypothetical protein